MLYAAAVLLVGVGAAHSYLGEKYILRRLFRLELPKLFGSDQFTKETLRFAWHLTTVAWCGFAAIAVALANGNSSIREIIAATFATSMLFPLIATRGRHLAWVVFLAIAVCCWFS